MLKSLCNSICKIKSRQGIWNQQLKLCSTVAKKNVENITASTDQFIEKETEILEVINKSNLTQLKKHINVSYAKTIILCRNNNGNYKSLNDILAKSGVELNILNQFYDSIINHKLKLKKNANKYKVTPNIEKMQVPNTLLGIHVGTPLLTWALINSNFEVVQWDSIPWYDEDIKKCSYNIIKLIGPIMEKLPFSDCYVAEDIQIKNISNKNILCHQKHLTIAIMSCLKFMETQRAKSVNTTYMLQDRASAHFNNLIIGNEVVSPCNVMQQILNNNTEENYNVHVDPALKHNYLSASTSTQEQMCWAVIKALVFLKLVQSS